MVLAEECDVSNITITSMKANKIEGNTEVISEPTFEDRTINLNLKMYDVGDSITYDLVIKNDSEEDYMIDEDTFKTDSDYIEYTLKTKDNTNVVKANSTKEVSLIVTYKKEVEDDKLTNNKFNASNTLKLSLNTSEKEQPLDIITTDNIKEVKNPVTSVSSMMLISIILLTSVIIIYILLKRKNKYNKYLLIILSMILIPTVYAICTCNIEVESTIEIEKKPKLFDTIANLAKEDNSCVTKYEGEVTDEVGKTVTATNVYFDKCVDMDNVIFGGFCWIAFRTTETSGTKMIYNGEPVDGKCESTRNNHNGLSIKNNSHQNISPNFLYGSSFNYDSDNKIFTIENTSYSTWNNSNYEKLLGKYTCLSNSNSCTTLYYVDDYYSNTEAYLLSIVIDDVNYYSIGIGPYNINENSLAKVGYMYNKKYNYNEKMPRAVYKYGTNYTYNPNTNTYTLSGDVISIMGENDWQDNLGNRHYTCWNNTGKCEKISYIYNILYDDSAIYLNIDSGKGINDVVREMLFDQDINKYDSNAKAIIEQWYKNNLLNNSDSIEDVVYCNNRSINDLGRFNPNTNVTNRVDISFNSTLVNDLTCSQVTDQFSISNNKAKLKYPIALITNPENIGLQGSMALIPFKDFYGMTPWKYNDTSSIVYYYSIGSYYTLSTTGVQSHIRPVISLKNKILISSGTGSKTDPWIIK